MQKWLQLVELRLRFAATTTTTNARREYRFEVEAWTKTWTSSYYNYHSCMCWARAYTLARCSAVLWQFAMRLYTVFGSVRCNVSTLVGPGLSLQPWSSYEAWQPVYLGRRFFDVSAWFGADYQLMSGFTELALQLQRHRQKKKETKANIENEQKSKIEKKYK